MVGNAFSEATGKKAKRPKNDVSDRDVVVLGSGNLGLVYLMEERRRLTLEEIDDAAPEAHPRASLASRTSAGCSSARPSTGRSRSAPTASTTSRRAASRARTRSRRSRRPRRGTCCAPTASQHVADIMVGSFYDPELDEGCAFEELICFHGGIGGLQTRPFILHPVHLEVPAEPIIGAASVHGVLAGWRQSAPVRRGRRGGGACRPDAGGRRGRTAGRAYGVAAGGRTSGPGPRTARPLACYWISVSILNIGRYIAMMMIPTTTPTAIIISGSMIDVRLAIALSTSSS